MLFHMEIQMFKKSLLFLSITLIISCFSYAKEYHPYPTPVDNYINDYAKIISEYDDKTIRKTLQDLETKTGIEITVVTINSIKDYKTNNTNIEEFATGLFNIWGVGNVEKNNGVMILAAIKDRKIRIELGSGYGRAYDSIMQKIINQDIVPFFKNQEYSRGIDSAVKSIISKITKPAPQQEKQFWWITYKWHLIIGGLIIVCLMAGISLIQSGKKGWGYFFFLLAGGLIVLLFWLIASGSDSKSGSFSSSSTSFGGGSSFGGGATGSW